MNRNEENIGRWTSREQSLFVEGLQKFGRSWKKISRLIETRTPDQVRSHAQKYEIKVKNKNFDYFADKREIKMRDCATQYGEGVFLPGFNYNF